jgi:ABC-type bacteriocin/lantibiotic exporter with double-glycine peptidase domain
MRINVPFYKQDTGYTCGPTSLQMVFSFFGSFKSEADLAENLLTNSVIGTKHQSMIDVATRNGFFCYVNNSSTFLELKHFIRKGLPVIVDFIEPISEEPHYAVVTGIVKKKVILNDPANGKGFEISEKDFLSRWRDTSTHSERWMMVISKGDLELGRQYRPHAE